MTIFLQNTRSCTTPVLDFETQPPRVLGLIEEAEKDSPSPLLYELSETRRLTTSLFAVIKRYFMQ